MAFEWLGVAWSALAKPVKSGWERTTMFFGAYKELKEFKRKRGEVRRFRGVPWTASDAPDSMGEGNVPLCPHCYEKGVETKVLAEQNGFNVRMTCSRAVHAGDPFDAWWSMQDYETARDNDEIESSTRAAKRGG